MKLKLYDIERLKADADCRVIARQIGMIVRGQFCECPSGLHSETQYNHCSLNRDYYNCFSCGDAGDVVHLVQQFYKNKLGQPLTIQEACRIIGDLCGGHELYLKDAEEDGKNYRQPLSKEDLDLLHFPASANGISAYADMQTLWRKNPDSYYAKIQEQCKKELQGMTALEAVLEEESATPMGKGLKNELQSRKSKIHAILNKSKSSKKR